MHEIPSNQVMATMNVIHIHFMQQFFICETKTSD